MANKLTREEWETHLYIGVDGVWRADTTIPKDMRKFEKQGWECVKRTYYDDGTVEGASFAAPRHAISIRKKERAVREMDEGQRAALAERLKAVREKRNEGRDDDD